LKVLRVYRDAPDFARFHCAHCEAKGWASSDNNGAATVVADSDDAGRINGRRLADALAAHGCEVRLIAGDIALCEALDLLAAGTGENKFRNAASVLRGTVLGRSAIDDKEALRRIAAFPPARRREAVGIVAGKIAGRPVRQCALELRMRSQHP
jgi:hypothetical protein